MFFLPYGDVETVKSHKSFKAKTWTSAPKHLTSKFSAFSDLSRCLWE